jgi:acetate kinase
VFITVSNARLVKHDRTFHLALLPLPRFRIPDNPRVTLRLLLPAKLSSAFDAHRSLTILLILVFNCGSSTLKFELIEFASGHDGGQTVARGMADRIGADSHLSLTRGDTVIVDRNVAVASHAEAAGLVLDALNEKLKLDAVAHRIVHGGERIVEPAIANEEVLEALEEASRFAPLHNPPALNLLREMRHRLPKTPMIVVADTAFHSHMPREARTYALPEKVAARHAIRRFGFHGTGYAWMLDRYAARSGRASDSLNLITLQLGAGCSAAAIRNGVSVDTSMGLTPLEGLMMATRSGDLDPAIVSYLARAENLSAEQVVHLLNYDSGLLGISGHKDMRELEHAAPHDERSALALEMFAYRARKYIGAYAAVLGRVDAVVFGGGIGEHSVPMRERICANLEKLGILLDPARNRAAETGERRISADQSTVEVWVIPVNEELYIARAAARLLET